MLKQPNVAARGRWRDHQGSDCKSDKHGIGLDRHHFFLPKVSAQCCQNAEHGLEKIADRRSRSSASDIRYPLETSPVAGLPAGRTAKLPQSGHAAQKSCVTASWPLTKLPGKGVLAPSRRPAACRRCASANGAADGQRFCPAGGPVRAIARLLRAAHPRLEPLVTKTGRGCRCSISDRRTHGSGYRRASANVPF